VLQLPGGEKANGRALTKWKRNGTHAQHLARNFLQKAGGTQSRHRINYRLATEYPASHRKTHCRITKMHEPHKHPMFKSAIASGEDPASLSAKYQGKPRCTRHNSAMRVARK
jgi:hypothetical protein